jgi:hypothetical protein
MKAMKCSSLMVAVFLIIGISMLFAYSDSGAVTAKEQPTVTNEDCVKCHTDPPAAIAAAGGKHTGVGCSGCHIGHPPAVKKPIPKCSQCHMGKPHFEIEGCLGCHKNPHTPLNISFAGNITEACLSCHTQQIAQLRDNKSKHTSLNCSTCHSVHRKVPECTQCHKPHSAEMAAPDCKKCHKAHMPKAVTYGAEIPSKDCGACHKKALDLLSSGATKHKTFECAFCHQAKHKMVPNCQDCHGAPHPAGIMAKFPKCGDCHNIAHDLNNWSAAKKEAPAEAPKKKK